MMDILWMLYFLSIPLIGAFGAAVISLAVAEPRKVMFVVVGLGFMAVGMNHHPIALKCLRVIAPIRSHIFQDKPMPYRMIFWFAVRISLAVGIGLSYYFFTHQ